MYAVQQKENVRIEGKSAWNCIFGYILIIDTSVTISDQHLYNPQWQRQVLSHTRFNHDELETGK